MSYLNLVFKLAKFHQKNKKKYEKILQNYKDAIPSFLSTKHFYKRRKAMIFNETKPNNIKLMNIKSSKKKETNSMLSKLSSQRNSVVTNVSISKLNDSLSSTNIFLDSDNNSKRKKKMKEKKHRRASYNGSYSVENKRNNHLKKPLTPADKIKLKSILKNFQKNQLTTNNLCKLEKKLTLNSITESNYLFLFTNYKTKNYHEGRMKHLLYNKAAFQNMPKSSLISFNMMKRFNRKTKKIYEEGKIEGIKYSKNINEFRKQIINSYKDSFSKSDLNQEKINYKNAINLLSSNQERKIQKAFQLEKEFYKTKYNENDFNVKRRDYINNFIEKRSKKLSMNKYIFDSISSRNSKYSISLSKDKDINQNEEKKVFDYNHIHKGSKSSTNSHVKSPLIKNQKNSTDSNHYNIKNLGNNIFLNYMKNVLARRSKINSIDFSAKQEYDNFVKQNIRERSKQLADSFASINNYMEYQPLKPMNSDMPHLNINDINLKRVVKVNEIKKNLFSYDDDDLLLHNVQKLKEELKDVELQYYSIDKHANKYNLSFLKNHVKRRTVEKVNAIKNPRFGVPC